MSLIKSSQFDDALKVIEALPAALKQQFAFEHAYVLHRKGNNKDALKQLRTLPQDQQKSLRYQFLFAGINYKLSEYQKSVQAYQSVLQDHRGDLEAEDVSDILVNYLACQSSQATTSLEEVNKLVSDYQGAAETYEYLFNLSQIYLKLGENETAYKFLKEAHDKAVQEDSFKDEQVRFKVQEMHFLNEIHAHYSSIHYSTEQNQTWFEFSKTIRNNILVELNISALSDVYALNSTVFKEVIGSLNWKKFAERIKTQLKENLLLTQNQRDTMQINAIICLIKANAFDEAKSLLEKTRKQLNFQG